jgi:hypothetical protein
MFKQALILGALAAILGNVDAANTKKKTKPKTKPTPSEADSSKKKSDDQNPVLRSIDKSYKIV